MNNSQPVTLNIGLDLDLDWAKVTTDEQYSVCKACDTVSKINAWGSGRSALLLSQANTRVYTSPHLTCGINSLLHSVNLIVFTLLLAHLILRISPHHSHHLRSHHLSLPRPFTPDWKLISFTNPVLHSHSYSFRTDFTDLNLYCIKGALALFVLVSFSGYVC